MRPKIKRNPIAKDAKTINQKYILQADLDAEKNIDTGIDYNMHFDLIDETIQWCDTTEETECKMILNDVVTNKDVFLGEFIKAILKINNISAELEKVCELIGDTELLHKLSRIPELTLKFIATNQSLYV